MSEIKASGNLNGHELNDLPVLNQGDWFGKTWLIEIGGSYSPLFLIVEAKSMSDAIDELADNEKYRPLDHRRGRLPRRLSRRRSALRS